MYLIFNNFLVYLQFGEVDPLHDEMLRKKEEQDLEKPHRHLFRFPHMAMWTKLRPGIWNFLERVQTQQFLCLFDSKCINMLIAG